MLPNPIKLNKVQQALQKTQVNQPYLEATVEEKCKSFKKDSDAHLEWLEKIEALMDASNP